MDTTAHPFRDHQKLFIDGRWEPAATPERIAVHNAGTGDEIGAVPACDERDVDKAVMAAAAALAGWAATSIEERAAFLLRISNGLERRAEELTQTIAREVGMPLKLASRVQVGLPVANFGNYAKLVTQFRFEERVGNSLVRRVPVGVVGAITPWNVPLHQIALKLAAAFAAGCTVVLKPSEVAPLNAFMLAEVVEDSALPAGVFNLVSGRGTVAGEALVRHPLTDMVSFTGSARAGRRIAEIAAQSMKRVTMELGGKSPSVILPDADLGLAVRSTVNSCFFNSGQACNAFSRMLVPAALHDEAARIAVETADGLLVGDPLVASTKLGPLTSADQLSRVRQLIRRGIADGATLLCGGDAPPANVPAGGYYVRPTVFGNVRNAMTIAREEIFGPVLSIIPYADEAEAIAIANDTSYGLAAAVWSADEEHARRVGQQIRAGQVDINGGAFNMNAPFGGFKQSGYGREAGVYGIEEYLEYQSLQFRAQPAGTSPQP